MSLLRCVVAGGTLQGLLHRLVLRAAGHSAEGIQRVLVHVNIPHIRLIIIYTRYEQAVPATPRLHTHGGVHGVPAPGLDRVQDTA